MQLTMIRKRQGRKRVVVVLEGIKASIDEKGTAPLRWALRQVVGYKDDLLVLTILNPMDYMASPNVGSFCCMGDQQPGNPYLGDKYIKLSHDQINLRRKAYLQFLRPYYDRCKANGVKIQVKVAVGIRPIAIMFEEAIGFKATWIIMDRCFGGDKSLRDDFNIALVNDNEEAEERYHLCLSDGSQKSTADEVKHNPRSYELLRGQVQTQDERYIYNPRSPKLLKESVSQEEPHIRDSLPIINGESRPFRLSFLVDISPEKEVQISGEPPLSERENSSKLKQPKDEIGEEAENRIPTEWPMEEPESFTTAETSTGGTSYYSEQSGIEEILEAKKEFTGFKRVKPGAGTLLPDKMSFGRLSDAMILLRQPLELSWEEIVEVTSGFHRDRCISKNDEFELYDGYLMDPYFHAMVKKFKGDSSGIVEAEKRVTCSLFHRNIMGLSAYHDSANATVLVYAFPHKGTLDQYLCGARREHMGLTFKDRLEIAIGIGRGLRYIHEECPRGPVVHNNIQPYNIFLTHGYQPLVSGFGRAMWLQTKQLVTDHTNRSGQEDTSNYDLMLLVKSDVLSFGVLLLRLFCRRSLPKDDKDLIELARPLLLQCAFHELLDQDMEDIDMYEIYRVMCAATQCTKTKPLCRPSMSQVVSILRGENSSVVGTSPSSSDGSVHAGTSMIP